MPEPDRTAITVPDSVLVQPAPDGEAVMLHLENESYFSLNAVAARMVEVLSTSESFAAAVTVLAGEYDADADTIRSDMEELVAALTERGLVVRP